MSHIPGVKGISGPRRKYEKAPTNANDELDDYERAIQTGGFDSREEMEISVVSTMQTNDNSRSRINKVSTVIISIFLIFLLLTMQPNELSPASSEIPDDELLPPLYDMNKICSAENVMTDDGRKLCERKCKSSLCCFENGPKSCFQENSFLCGKYSACQNILVDTKKDTDDNIISEKEEEIETDSVELVKKKNLNEPIIKPAPKNIQDLCSPMNTETATGILECEAACEGGSCCWEDKCEDDNREECSNYEVCKNIGSSLSIVEKVKHACSVSKIGVLSSSLTADERLKNRYKCKDLCDVRSCCFSSGVENCYWDNTVWCDEFSVCKTLANTDKDSPPTLPPTPIDINLECTDESLLSSSDYVKCQDSCMVASCCFSNEGCLKKGVNCDEFSGCKQFLQYEDVPSSTVTNGSGQINDDLTNNRPIEIDDKNYENNFGDFEDEGEYGDDVNEIEVEYGDDVNEREVDESEYGDDTNEREFVDESEYGDDVNESEFVDGEYGDDVNEREVDESEYGDDVNESEYGEYGDDVNEREVDESEYGDDVNESEFVDGEYGDDVNEREVDESEYGDDVNESEYGEYGDDVNEREVDESEYGDDANESEFVDGEYGDDVNESEFLDGEYGDDANEREFVDESEYGDDTNEREVDNEGEYEDLEDDKDYNEELKYEIMEYQETVDDDKMTGIDKKKYSGAILDDDIFVGNKDNDDDDDDDDEEILHGGSFTDFPGPILSSISPEELENICDPEYFDDEGRLNACKMACEPGLCCVGVGKVDCSITHKEACGDFIACNPYWEVEGYQIRIFVTSNNPQITNKKEYMSENEEDFGDEDFELLPPPKSATLDSEIDTIMPTISFNNIPVAVPARSPSSIDKITPLSINSICSKQNLQDEDGFNYCVLQCNQALCCLGVGHNCSESKKEWCAKFSACSSVWYREKDQITYYITAAPSNTVTHNPTSSPHYLPLSTVNTKKNKIASKSIDIICSDDNLRTKDGFNYCVLECNQALCCTGIAQDCSVSEKKWCEEFSVCSKVWTAQYSGPNERSPENLKEDETEEEIDDYLVTNFGESFSSDFEYSTVDQDDNSYKNEEEDFDDHIKRPSIANPSSPTATIPKNMKHPVTVKTICSDQSLEDQGGYNYCVLECNQALCCIGIGHNCLESKFEWCKEFSVCHKVWSEDADEESLINGSIEKQISMGYNSVESVDEFDDLSDTDNENDEESESDYSPRYPSPTFNEKYEVPAPTVRMPSLMITKEEKIEAPNHLNSICSDANIYIAEQVDDCIVECNKALCCVGVGQDCSESRMSWCSSYSVCNKVWFPQNK